MELDTEDTDIYLYYIFELYDIYAIKIYMQNIDICGLFD